jgi:Zn-dependent protease with chaperone function
MTDSSLPETTPCPQCGASIPSGPGWEMWCEVCEWNLEGPAKPAATKSRSELRAERRAEQLHQEMMAAASDRGRHSAARWLTFLFAVLVHLPAVALLIAAAAIVTRAGLDPPLLVAAAVLIGLAVVVRPRLGNLPKRWPVQTRSHAPELFKLMDRISGSLHARPVDWIAFDLDYNFSTAMVGIRRRRLITVGLPLWTILTPAERVAILAHEVAHDTNGDLSHSLVVGSALEILSTLSRWLSPPRRFAKAEANTIARTGEELAALTMRGLSLGAYGCLRVLLYYTRRASPRAEYLADEEAARVASPQAAISGFDKLCLWRPFMFRLRAAAKRRDPDVWHALIEESTGFPPRGHERLRRIGRRLRQKADDTHPITALRIEALRHLPESTPLVVLSPQEVMAIEHELSGVRSQLAALITARDE